MSLKSGWCMSGHHEGCRSPHTCPCDCHDPDGTPNDYAEQWAAWKESSNLRNFPATPTTTQQKDEEMTTTTKRNHTRKLTVDQAAQLVGIAPITWRSYVSRGNAPAADGRNGRSPYWHESTVKAWAKSKGMKVGKP